MFLGFVKRIRPGYMGLIYTDQGIAFLCLPQDTAEKARQKILQNFSHRQVEFTSSHDPVKRIWKSLEGYFQGKVKTFDYPLNLDTGTDFEKSVWKWTCRIPYGETRSYGWVAEKTGHAGACRAVGNALGKNRVPILVPCHRVIRADGGLGGFGAGIAWKKKLWELEQAGKR